MGFSFGPPALNGNVSRGLAWDLATSLNGIVSRELARDLVTSLNGIEPRDLAGDRAILTGIVQYLKIRFRVGRHNE